MAYVLLNKFESHLDEDVRVLAVDETLEGLIEYIEEAEDLEVPLNDAQSGYWVETVDETDAPRSPFSGGPTVLRTGYLGGSGWYEIVRVGA